MKVLDFKTRQQQFKEWLKEVEKENFENKEVISAVFMWEYPKTKEGYQGLSCGFNCPLDQLKWFHRELGELIKEREFDKYLTEHLAEYIELV